MKGPRVLKKGSVPFKNGLDHTAALVLSEAKTHAFVLSILAWFMRRISLS